MRFRAVAPVFALLCGLAAGARAQAPLFPTPFRGPTPTTLPTLPPRPKVIPPPALTVTATFSIYDYNKISLPMRIDNYPFEELNLNDLPHGLGNFMKIPGITYGSNLRRDSNGTITFSVMGYFVPGGNRVVLPLTSPRPSDSRSYTVSATVSKSPRTTYTVTDTWSLRDKLHPQLLGSGLGSFCNGKPPVGKALGLMRYNEKISFRGQGGPLGTACVWGLTEMLVHNGTLGASWRVIRSGPGEQCKASTDLPYGAVRPGFVTVNVNGDFVGSAILFSDAREVSDGGVVFATNNTSPVTVLKPTIIQYSCPITLGTDAPEVLFVLDRVTLLGPPGIQFP